MACFALCLPNATMAINWRCVRGETSLFDSCSRGASSIHLGASACLPADVLQKGIEFNTFRPMSLIRYPARHEQRASALSCWKSTQMSLWRLANLIFLRTQKKSTYSSERSIVAQLYCLLASFKGSSRSLHSSSIQSVNDKQKKRALCLSESFFSFKVWTQHIQTNSTVKQIQWTKQHWIAFSTPLFPMLTTIHRDIWLCTDMGTKEKHVVFRWTFYFAPCLYSAISRSYLSFSVRALSS